MRLRHKITELFEQNFKQATLLADKEEEILFLEHRLKENTHSDDQEFSGYRSEFFTKLREVLGNHPNIRIAGDRFLFQSELLFASASADLEKDGEVQLDRVAETLLEIAGRIPPDVNWVLQVNGHTDKRPIKTARFPSNWELSTERALSIVRYLINKGIPPNRLAATGFAEFDPIDPADNLLAYGRNRRIELKFTNR
jgi:chemotaxis protein MotB